MPEAASGTQCNGSILYTLSFFCRAKEKRIGGWWGGRREGGAVGRANASEGQ